MRGADQRGAGSVRTLLPGVPVRRLGGQARRRCDRDGDIRDGRTGMSEPEGGPILLIGAGRMGYALLRGWLTQGVAKNRVIVQEPAPHPEVAEYLRDAGISSDVPVPPDVIVLAVKPQL